jgi:plastocyanin
MSRKMMRKGIVNTPAIILVVTSLVYFAACTGSRDAATGVVPTGADHASMNHGPGAMETGAAHTVEFQSDPAELQANQPSALSFTVKDSRGSVVKDLQIVHEKPMHLLIVSKDLAEFYHVHPEQSPDGSYKVTHTFPNGGDYRLYVDFTPARSAQIVDQIDVNVRGPERPRVALAPDTKFEKTVDGLKVVMKPSAKISAGQELMLNFQAFDAVSGKPATDLQNYLGELAHFVIISEDLQDFVHAHPMAKGESMDSMNAGDARASEHSKDGHQHSAKESNADVPGRSEVSAHTTFPRAGLYKLWAQFQRAGKVISVPFVVNVPKGKNDSARAAKVPPGFIKITVSEKGYEPSTVNVRKGEKVSLAFYREDADNCGGEVVFANQEIKKTLPVGETVLVEFTPAAAGELSFACGMDMLKGKVVVSEN